MIRFTVAATLACILSLTGCQPTQSESRTSLAAAPHAAPQRADGHSPANRMKLDLADGVSLTLIEIPAGKFIMGSPPSELHRQSTETQRELAISRPFYMGVTHVTVKQFEAFAKDAQYATEAEKQGESGGFRIEDGTLIEGPLSGFSWKRPGYDQPGDHPAVYISWNDAVAFCSWLSKKTGKNVLLPTEAQWEYACRAGTTTAYFWGDDPEAGKGWANCADATLRKALPNAPADWTFFTWNDGYAFTAPVARFKPNAFGLFDMAGNAWQWCLDGPPQTDSDPEAQDRRFLVGGCWCTNVASCRAAFRMSWPANTHHHCTSFRVAVIP